MSNQVVQRVVRVGRLSTISGDVYQVIVAVIDGKPMAWHAGQYLELVMPIGSPCAYSIASAVTDGLSLELHIQCCPGQQRAREVIEYLRSADTVPINMPMGNCFIDRYPDTPLVFIAAGTGFAQMKAMVEYSLSVGSAHPVHLYWGARTPAGFYMPSLPVYWASEKGVYYHPVVSDRDGTSDWEGRHGLLHQAVLEDIEQLTNAHFYISGSPEMVYATLDALVENGIPETQVHSDVFSYCPRNTQ